MSTSPYRVVIADDHSLIRKGLRTIIELESDMQVIGEAGDGEELLNFLARNQPNLVVMDISMPNLNGIDAIEKVLALYPDIRILILTMHRNSQYFYNAISAGAHGYLIKDDSDTELLTAIETVRSGKTYISPQLSTEVTDAMFSAFREHRDPSMVGLTPREQDVLGLVVKGYTSKQIADVLCLSPRTIDHHRANLLKKFKMKNTIDLVKYVIENSIILPE